MKERTFIQKCNISLNGILSGYDKSFSAILDTKKRKEWRFIGLMVHHICIIFAQSHVFQYSVETKYFLSERQNEDTLQN